MPEGLFFFDTVTLANFALADAMPMLEKRYGKKMALTPDVIAEVGNGIAAGHLQLQKIEESVAAGLLTVALLTAEERRSKISLLHNLGAGEASCIACAKHRGGIVVTDDRAARSCCAEHGIGVTGTIGILLALVRDDMLACGEADAILAKMVKNGFYSPLASIACLL